MRLLYADLAQGLQKVTPRQDAHLQATQQRSDALHIVTVTLTELNTHPEDSGRVP